MYLSNKKIYLKKLTLKYVSHFKVLFNDNEMCKHLAIPYPLNDSWIKSYITESMELFKNLEKYTWGIFRHQMDDLVGVAVLRDIDLKNKTARIGYSTGKKFWNNAYTIMTVRLVLNYAYKKLEINRIEVRIDVDDNRSKKLLHEIGGVCEGLLRKALYYNDSFKDVLLYSVLKEDYYARLEEKIKQLQ